MNITFKTRNPAATERDELFTISSDSNAFLLNQISIKNNAYSLLRLFEKESLLLT